MMITTIALRGKFRIIKGCLQSYRVGKEPAEEHVQLSPRKTCSAVLKHRVAKTYHTGVLFWLI